MKRVLNDLTPLPGNDLFITQYWFDKQTDPPLHFHEDYMLSLTLNVKGTRVTGQSVDNFTEKDLIIIFPRVPHCYKRDEAFAETNCEAVAVQFSRDMPNWQIFETESMLPIRKMLSGRRALVRRKRRRPRPRQVTATARAAGIRIGVAFPEHTQRPGHGWAGRNGADRCPVLRNATRRQCPDQQDRTVRGGQLPQVLPIRFPRGENGCKY